jgi:Family of unknown function (DUF6228)
LRHHDRVPQPFTLELPDSPTWVIDPPLDPHGDGYVREARVEIRADGLAAHTIATLDYSPETLAAFFNQLAADWRGWEGERRWKALEGMAIEARHNGRAHVLVAVTIEHSWYTSAGEKDAWSARVVIALEAGEQLTAVARQLASLLGK